MSKFNPKAASTIERGYSANGNLQDVKSVEQQAYELVVNTLYGRDSFYESTDAKAARMADLFDKLVAKGKVDFVANLLDYARNEMHIRNMPIMGLKVFSDALHSHNRPFSKMRNLTTNVVKRADQITDALALFVGKTSKAHLPMAIKRGLADAFNNFDEYQFAKYNRNSSVTFKDAIRIVHPVPASEGQNAIFQAIVKDSLKTPDTWEVALSTNGQKSEADKRSQKEIWEDLIDRKKLAPQATLKNLRNMVQANVSEAHLDKVARYLVNGVHTSKSLPFEYLAAFDAVVGFTKYQPLINALYECMDKAADNIPVIGEKIWVIVDTSGSMKGRAADTACFLASALARANRNAKYFAVTLFDTSAHLVALNTNAPVMSNYIYLKSKIGGGSTNFAAALAQESLLGFKPDTVFVLTDGEINRFGQDYSYYYGLNTAVSSESAVTKAAPGAEKFIINMESAETTPLPARFGWHFLSGWSPKLFDFIEAIKRGSSVVKELDVPYPYKG